MRPTQAPIPPPPSLTALAPLRLRPRLLFCACVLDLNATVGISSRRYLSHFSADSLGIRSILFSTRITRFSPLPRLSTKRSTSTERVPCGSRASRTWSRMSAVSTTLTKSL